MNRPSRLTTKAPKRARLLSISPVEQDHTALEHILNEAATATRIETPWQLLRTRTLESALTQLRRVEHAVVVCERDLNGSDWKDLLAGLRQLPNPPLLVVTSRLADEYLWAEALNLGAYDVLAKPFFPAETIRVITLASVRWERERQHAGPFAETAVGKSATRKCL